MTARHFRRTCHHISSERNLSNVSPRPLSPQKVVWPHSSAHIHKPSNETRSGAKTANKGHKKGAHLLAMAQLRPAQLQTPALPDLDGVLLQALDVTTACACSQTSIPASAWSRTEQSERARRVLRPYTSTAANPSVPLPGGVRICTLFTLTESLIPSEFEIPSSRSPMPAPRARAVHRQA